MILEGSLEEHKQNTWKKADLEKGEGDCGMSILFEHPDAAVPKFLESISVSLFQSFSLTLSLLSSFEGQF